MSACRARERLTPETAYWIAIYDDGEPVQCRTQADLLEWIAEPGRFRAATGVLEVIERQPDGTVNRYSRDAVDGWCTERDLEIEAERRHERELRADYHAAVL